MVKTFDTLTEACRYARVVCTIPKHYCAGFYLTEKLLDYPKVNPHGRILFFEEGEGGLVWNMISGKKALFERVE